MVLLLLFWVVLSFFVALSLAAFNLAEAFNQLLCSTHWHSKKSLFENAQANRSRVFCCNAGSHFKFDVLPFLLSYSKRQDSSKAGSWIIPDDQACSLCPIGRYSSTLNINRSCTLAARDKFVPAKGMNLPTDCNSYSFTNEPNTTFCKVCPAGYRMTRGNIETTCVECDAGKFQDVPGIETCNNCPIGYYQSEEGIPYCVGCIPGQYQDQDGNESCIKCASGRQFNATIVSSSVSNCVACARGQYQPEDGSTFCLPCLTGTFQNVTGSSSCQDCPIGFSNGDTNEEESCTGCKAGKFQDAIKEANCRGMLYVL